MHADADGTLHQAHSIGMYFGAGPLELRALEALGVSGICAWPVANPVVVGLQPRNDDILASGTAWRTRGIPDDGTHGEVRDARHRAQGTLTLRSLVVWRVGFVCDGAWECCVRNLCPVHSIQNLFQRGFCPRVGCVSGGREGGRGWHAPALHLRLCPGDLVAPEVGGSVCDAQPFHGHAME